MKIRRVGFLAFVVLALQVATVSLGASRLAVSKLLKRSAAFGTGFFIGVGTGELLYGRPLVGTKAYSAHHHRSTPDAQSIPANSSRH